MPQYDFNWQSGYRFSEPKRLPAGTVIRARGSFDNSAQNPFNPNPNVIVRGGDQTDDEMFIGYINYAELGEKAPARAPSFSANLAARARVGEVFRLPVAAATATTLSAAGLPEGLSLTGDVITGTPKSAGRSSVRLTAANAVGSAASILDLTVAPASGAPEFTSHPRSVRARLGSTVTFTAAVNSGPGTVYTWYVRGGEFCNTEGPALTLTNLTAAHAGDWVCVASNPAGSSRSEAASLSLEFSGLVNLSARASVGTGANVVIPGITVRGTKPKTLLIRAAGPALAAFGVGGTLANPVLGVFDATGDRVLANDNWSEVPNLAELRAATSTQGAFTLPEGSRDAAILVTLPPGGYTVQVAGAGTGAAAQGVAIVEIYEADANPSTLVNLSCRANVGVDDNILIAGFTISGSSPKRVLIRGVGRSAARSHQPDDWRHRRRERQLDGRARLRVLVRGGLRAQPGQHRRRRRGHTASGLLHRQGERRQPGHRRGDRRGLRAALTAAGRQANIRRQTITEATTPVKSAASPAATA